MAEEVPLPSQVLTNTSDQQLITMAQSVAYKYGSGSNYAEVLPKEDEAIPPNPPIASQPHIVVDDWRVVKFDKFEIRYKKKIEDKDVEFVYSFALLPAIENVFRGSGQNVPDVTPGIKMQTEMNYQRQLVPGAPPVYQSMGIKGSYVFLVGTFIGNEVNTKGNSPPRPNPAILDVRLDGDKLPTSKTLQLAVGSQAGIDSYLCSKVFDEEIIQNGRPVTININAASDRTDSNVQLTIYGIIEAMRRYCVRADRTYYAITISSLRFKWNKGHNKDAPNPNSNKTPGANPTEEGNPGNPPTTSTTSTTPTTSTPERWTELKTTYERVKLQLRGTDRKEIEYTLKLIESYRPEQTEKRGIINSRVEGAFRIIEGMKP